MWQWCSIREVFLFSGKFRNKIGLKRNFYWFAGNFNNEIFLFFSELMAFPNCWKEKWPWIAIFSVNLRKFSAWNITVLWQCAVKYRCKTRGSENCITVMLTLPLERVFNEHEWWNYVAVLQLYSRRLVLIATDGHSKWAEWPMSYDVYACAQWSQWSRK